MNFTKDLTGILSAYNNNILEFTSTDEVKQIVNCTVTVGDYTFKLTPNLDRKFRTNLKTISKVLTNLNNFNDTISPNLSNEIIYNDTTLYHELSVNYRINFDDDTFEEVTKVHKFLKSVKQIIRDKSDVDARLFPLINKNGINYYITYFEGYPFDFSFFSNDTRTIILINQTTQQEIELSVTKGVNRLFTADGITNLSLENILPLVLGTNRLDFKIGTDLIFTIYLFKEDAECGTYLKWFNQQGSYSYWKFPERKVNQLKSRNISDIDNDFKNIENTTSNISTTGKTGGRNINTISQLLSEYEVQHLEQIFTSPKVYLLTAERFTKIELEDWSEVKIYDSTLSYPPKATRYKIPIRIELPKLNTQTL